MLQRVIIWTLLASLWRRYGKVVRLLPFVLLILFVISMLHSDYVDYVQVSEDRSFLPWSFVAKWLLIFFVIAAYWRFALSVIRRKESKREPSLKKMGTLGEGQGRDNAGLSEHASHNDPFRAIREKKHLRSKAELLIQRKQRGHSK